jgi:DNA-binding transcriptional regulator YhcF (GntR family)
MPIRENDPRPAYEQLADELRQAITTGEYAPGDRLPSTRELSEVHGIAPMTVRNALRVLEDERLVVARQGRGVFVRPPEQPAVDPLATVQASLDKTMKMLEGINDRLDRYDAARGTDTAKEPVATDAGRDAMLDVDGDLNAAMKDLAEAAATLDMADDLDGPGLEPPLPPSPAPDRGHELGM